MSTSTRNRTAAGNGAARNARTEEQIVILTEALTRLDLARAQGYQYGTDRDIYATGGYPTTIKFSEYKGLYDRDGIAGRIVDMPAQTTWRNPPKVSEEGQKDGTEFTKAWDALAQRLGVWGRLERADRLSRIGRYGVLLIGVAGDDSQLEREMPQLQGPDAVLYLSAFTEQHAQIDSWVVDPRDPRFGQPLTYKIDLTSGVSSFQPTTGSSTQVVHWSRLIHIAEGLLEDEVYGRPPLQRVYNDLHDLQKVSTSTGEGYWQRVAGILQAKIDPESTITEEQLLALDENLQKLYHDLKRTFYGKGVELSRLAEGEPDPEAAADLFFTKIAAGAGFPKRILFGSETGERASTEDQKTWLGSIAERQKQHAEPMILRALIDRLVEKKALPRPGRAGYQVVWPPLFEESAQVIAEANKARAETAKALTPIGGSPLDLVEVDEERNVLLRPTGERGELTPEELEPPEPPEPVAPPAGDGAQDGEEPEPPARQGGE